MEEVTPRRVKQREHLASRLDKDCIDYLKWKFETELCCFQGKRGNFDSLDAMRRDAQREVVLYLNYLLENASKS